MLHAGTNILNMLNGTNILNILDGTYILNMFDMFVPTAGNLPIAE
jgi:hypothetical protein